MDSVTTLVPGKFELHVDSDSLPDPEILAAEIIGELRAALAELEDLAEELDEMTPLNGSAFA